MLGFVRVHSQLRAMQPTGLIQLGLANLSRTIAPAYCARTDGPHYDSGFHMADFKVVGKPVRRDQGGDKVK
jgi:hypothetical protein